MPLPPMPASYIHLTMAEPCQGFKACVPRNHNQERGGRACPRSRSITLAWQTSQMSPDLRHAWWCFYVSAWQQIMQS